MTNSIEKVEVNKQVFEFIKNHNNISISDLEDILETLKDMEMFNSDGEIFRDNFWRLFIKK